MLVVPGEELWHGAMRRLRRHPYAVSVQGVVVAPVLELFADPAAYFETPFRRDCHVAAVEERVQVTSQQKSIVDAMGATGGVWLEYEPPEAQAAFALPSPRIDAHKHP